MEASNAGWGLLGFFFPFIAVMFAHAIIPLVPGPVMANHEDESTPRIFEASYLNYVKDRQVDAAWIGS